MVPAVMTSHIHCTTDENLVFHPGYVYLLSMIVLLMTIRLGTHLSPTISSDAATLHFCKQQQIASSNKYY